jgi:hypothetical protein
MYRHSLCTSPAPCSSPDLFVTDGVVADWDCHPVSSFTTTVAIRRTQHVMTSFQSRITTAEVRRVDQSVAREMPNGRGSSQGHSSSFSQEAQHKRGLGHARQIWRKRASRRARGLASAASFSSSARPRSMPCLVRSESFRGILDVSVEAQLHVLRPRSAIPCPYLSTT